MGSKRHDWRGKVEEWEGICPPSISVKKGPGLMAANFDVLRDLDPNKIIQKFVAVKSRRKKLVQ